jgi:small-conductance mechanosensitive channel
MVALSLWCLGAWQAAAAARPAAPPRATPVAEEAPIVVWNRTITVLRSPFGQFSAADRARRAEQKIHLIPEGEREYRVEAVDAQVGPAAGAWITVNGSVVFGILTSDADQESGEPFEAYKRETVAALEAWLAARAEQRRVPILLRGIALSLAATLLWIALVVLLLRFRRWWLARATAAAERRRLMVGDVDLRPYLIGAESGLLRLATWAAALTLGYVWLAFVFSQFPYSRPWARHLRDFFVDLVAGFATAIIDAIPDLVKVAVIFLVARLVSRATRAFFRAVETGAMKPRWLEEETARTTRRLVTLMIWLFAIVIAYPYIPGSDTPAFKGLSVLLGLMVSLGSAGLVSQIIGGLVMVYTRAFRPGDFVKVSDHEGVVVEMGMLSTKIQTVRREEITIPNAVLVGTTAVNYSRRAEPDGAIVMTTVSIGYDAPWRQVHAMLLRAAAMTEGVRPTPAPRVLQRSLGDFAVEYALFINIDRAEQRYRILSVLHANIQDAFNEFGVQIMTPHFEGQPERPTVVSRSDWYAPPAAPPVATDGGAADRDEEEPGEPRRPH